MIISKRPTKIEQISSNFPNHFYNHFLVSRSSKEIVDVASWLVGTVAGKSMSLMR
jgi:hypothetical protein